MIRIELNDQPFSIRENWQELDEPTLLAIIPHIFHHDRHAAQTALVPILSDIPSLLLFQLAPWQLAELMRLTNWVWTLPMDTPVFTAIQHNGTSYGLPSPDATNITLLEYHTAEGFLLAFTSGEPEGIDKLTATLLRPITDPDNTFDTRKKLDTYALARDVAALATLDPRIKLAVMWYFHGLRRSIQEQYAMLWQSDDEPKEKNRIMDFGDDEEIDFGWIGVAYSLAESGPFGHFNAVLSTDIHTVLYCLAYKKQEGEKKAREMKNLTEKNTL